MTQFDPGDSPSIASITDRVRPLAIGMTVTAIHFLGDTAVFVGTEENAALVSAAGEISTVAIHGGAIPGAGSGRQRLVSGVYIGGAREAAGQGAGTVVSSRPDGRDIGKAPR